MTASQTDNAAKMKAAVARWIAEASTMSSGTFLLNAKIEWLEAQSRLLSRNGKVPVHLKGLTAFDLADGIETLATAVEAMRAATVQKAALYLASAA